MKWFWILGLLLLFPTVGYSTVSIVTIDTLRSGNIVRVSKLTDCAVDSFVEIASGDDIGNIGPAIVGEDIIAEVPQDRWTSYLSFNTSPFLGKVIDSCIVSLPVFDVHKEYRDTDLGILFTDDSLHTPLVAADTSYFHSYEDADTTILFAEIPEYGDTLYLKLNDGVINLLGFTDIIIRSSNELDICDYNFGAVEDMVSFMNSSELGYATLLVYTPDKCSCCHGGL